MPNEGNGAALMKSMKPKENERIAVCRVLLDIKNSVGACCISFSECRHYQQLKDKVGLTDRDFDSARKESVLSSLIALKGMHYNVKMMLALTVCDLYSEDVVIPLNHRLVFETLMQAIDWPISFSEMLTLSTTE